VISRGRLTLTSLRLSALSSPMAERGLEVSLCSFILLSFIQFSIPLFAP
jgi:hypothetical protein